MSRRAPRGDEEPVSDAAGSTLIEILLASVLMGSAIIVMVAGMGTLFASSTQNRQATTAGVVVRDYAESLIAAVGQAGTPAGGWCGSSYTVAYAPPTDYPVTVVYGPCPAYNATPAVPQFQNATLTATAPTGLVETLKIVVRQT